MQRVKSGMPAAGPLAPPIEPMLAKIAEALPSEPGFLFEPKWDGFRALVFRGTEQTYIQSRDLRPLNRYFPELEKALHEALPKGCVLDGEIVVAGPRGLDFDALQQRHTRFIQEREEQGLLAREMKVEPTFGRIRGAGDLVDRGVTVAMLGEDLECGVEHRICAAEPLGR